MATRKYIADRLREISEDELAEASDDDVISIANRCQCRCRRKIFSDEEIDRFIAGSESAEEFLKRVYLGTPSRRHGGNEKWKRQT